MPWCLQYPGLLCSLFNFTIKCNNKQKFSLLISMFAYWVLGLRVDDVHLLTENQSWIFWVVSSLWCCSGGCLTKQLLCICWFFFYHFLYHCLYTRPTDGSEFKWFARSVINKVLSLTLQSKLFFSEENYIYQPWHCKRDKKLLTESKHSWLPSSNCFL